LYKFFLKPNEFQQKKKKDERKGIKKFKLKNAEHVIFSSGSKQTVSSSTTSSFISSFSPRRTSTKKSHERQLAKNMKIFILFYR